MLASLAGGLAVLFPSGPGTPVGPYRAGTVAGGDVLAEVGFDVPKDSTALERERQEAAAAVVPTFVQRPDAPDSALFALAFLFNRLDTVAASGGTAGIAGVLSAIGVEPRADQLEVLSSASARRRLADRAATAARRFLPQGVMAPGAASGLVTDSVRVLRDGQAEIVHRDSVLSGREFYDRAVEGLGPGPEEGLLRSILGQVVNMSLVLDGVRTERERRIARDAVPVVAARVVEGEAIVRANQQLGDAEIRRLEAYRAELRAQGRGVDRSALASIAGALVLNTLVLGVFGVLVFLYRRNLYQTFRSLSVVAGTFALYFLAAFLLAAQGAPAAALPVTFVAVTLAILWDGRLALAAAFVLAAVTALQEPFAAVHDFATVFVGGAAAALVVRAYRRLAQTWVFIAVVAAAYAVVLFGLQLRGAEIALWPSLAGALAGAVVCAILAVGFLPVFEWLTGITTDQTLIAWADANRPLMRTLAVEAPGTYAHTMQVAALAEAGADAVGANALLCRAGAYYHDVGKTKRPGFFIENQQDGRLALAAAFVLAAVTALQEPFAAVHDFATVFVGGAAAALVVRAYRRLAQTWVFIAVVAAAYAVVLFGLQLRGAEIALWPSLAGALAGAVVCAILAVGFLPVFEWLTGITTDQTLIAWADANRPLMRTLAVEAPGTYAHTMQVAALAEAGADAVGANALLCRAGAYYHDVGKTKRPGFFIENQQDGDNPHDRLEPVDSATVIREHVDEGLRLARRAKVPRVLASFIAEHHGDQFIGFFYRKAVQRAEQAGAAAPDPSPFRYPGPRPQSRETGIAMLADAVESSARALKNPTRKRIAGLIDKIFAQRLVDGQLDDTELTLRDLAVLKARFAKVLGGVYHRRIDYPQPEPEPPAEALPAGADAAPDADTDPDADFNTDVDMDPKSDAHSNANADTDPGPDTHSNANAVAAPDADPDTDADSDADAVAALDADAAEAPAPRRAAGDAP